MAKGNLQHKVAFIPFIFFPHSREHWRLHRCVWAHIKEKRKEKKTGGRYKQVHQQQHRYHRTHTHAHTHTRTHIRTYKHAHTLSLSLSHAHTELTPQPAIERVQQHRTPLSLMADSKLQSEKLIWYVHKWKKKKQTKTKQQQKTKTKNKQINYFFKWAP